MKDLQVKNKMFIESGLEPCVDALKPVYDDIENRISDFNRIIRVRFERGKDNDITINFITDVSTKKTFEWTLDFDCSNWNNIRYDIESDWNETLKYLGNKEDFEHGTAVDGHKVYFKKVFAGYEFSPSELETLKNGGFVDIEYTDRNGELREMHGCICKNEYNGSLFYGFSEPRYKGIWNGEPVNFKMLKYGRLFNEDECASLCRGDILKSVECYRQDGSSYLADLQLARDSFRGNDFVGISFANYKGIPLSMSGYYFTDEELETLANGGVVYSDKLWSKKKNASYDAWLIFDNQSKKIGFVDFSNPEQKKLVDLVKCKNMEETM